MGRESKIELTNLCIVCDGNRILMEETNREGEKGFVFPGGHVETGESLQASVIREIYEETGLTIKEPVLCGIKNWIQPDGVRYMVLLYRADRFTGSLKSSDEGKVSWVTLEEFGKINVLWYMREVYELVMGEKSELFAVEEDDSEEFFWQMF